jgi:hypothetical protein
MKKNTKKILIGVVILSAPTIWAQQIPLTNEESTISGGVESEPESVSEILYQELLLAKALDAAEDAVTNALNSGLSYESTKEIVLLVMIKNSLLTELSILEESSLLSVVGTPGPASETAVDQTSAVETTVDEAASAKAATVETAVDEAVSAKAATVETAVDQTTTVETAGSETSGGQNTADKAPPLTVDTTTNELLDEGFVETNFESLRSRALSVNNELAEIIIGGSITSSGNGFIPTGDGSVSNTGDTYN